MHTYIHGCPQGIVWLATAEGTDTSAFNKGIKHSQCRTPHLGRGLGYTHQFQFDSWLPCSQEGRHTCEHLQHHPHMWHHFGTETGSGRDTGLVDWCVHEEEYIHHLALQALAVRTIVGHMTDALTNITVSSSKSGVTDALVWVVAVSTN